MGFGEEWWKAWKKPDGSSCTYMEIMRAFVHHRRRQRAWLRQMMATVNS